MNEEVIREFWNAHPCGENQIRGDREDYDVFFNKYDAFRFRQHPHLLRCLDEINFHGKRVLEIGLGLGADSEQIIRRGGIWSGVDLTPESVERVSRRLALRNLPYEKLLVGSACKLPFEDEEFDLVYSHGVLHHIPEIHKAQAEIARVLKPNGQLVVMVYAKYSLNYLVSIFFFRRLLLLLIYAMKIRPQGMVGQHVENAQKAGIWNYLKMDRFIHRNTDGPLNPYSKVYDLKEIQKDFTNFKIMKSYKRFMHAPPLPVTWLPFEKLMGWHLWVHLSPRKPKA